MSDLDIIEQAIRNLQPTDAPTAIAFSLKTERRLQQAGGWADLAPTEYATMFGYRVIIAPWMPKNEIHIKSDSETIKIVNLG